MIRVGDLDRSIDFYTAVLGMRLLRKRDYPDGKFTLAFVGYADESDQAAIAMSSVTPSATSRSRSTTSTAPAPTSPRAAVAWCGRPDR